MPDSHTGIPKYALCGRVTGAHGVRGWVKVFSHTSPAETLLTYTTWQLRRADTQTEHAVTDGQPTGKTLAAKLAGIDDRDAALALRGSEIWIATEQFAPLADGEYYHQQLLGLTAIDQHGTALGQVAEILETGANDVLVVRGDTEVLVPYVPGVTVFTVDLHAQQINVRYDGVSA